jgi:lipid-binding SYLF domain-containing protein
MKKAILFAAFASLSLTGIARAEGTSREATQERLRHAGEVLHEVMGAPDRGIPEEVLQHAKCIAVVPHLVKGGFVFGAEGGRGVATCRTPNGWSAPAFFSITGGNWGLQIGVEGIDLVMIFQGDKGMDRLVQSKFEVGADASVAAGPVGRHASADTDWKMNAEILTYSRAKGIFAGITLNGAAVRRDDDSTDAFYGHEIPTRDLLMGQVPPPAGSGAFLDAIHDAKVQAEANR